MKVRGLIKILKKENIDEIEDYFCGWGCYGIIEGGKRHPNFEMLNWTNLEKMVEAINKSHIELIGIQIFKCYLKNKIDKRIIGEK